MTAIRFSTRSADAKAAARAQCAILPLGPRVKLDAFGRALDKESAGAVGAAIASVDFRGEVGETLLLHCGGSTARVLLVGCGEQPATRDSLRKVVDAVATALVKTRAADALLHSPPLRVRSGDWEWFSTTLARRVVSAAYRYTTTLSKPKPGAALKRLTLQCADGAGARKARAALERGRCTGEGINLARELANLPGNHCTPEYLAKTARKLARGKDRASCKVLNEKAMAELGMGSLLSVDRRHVPHRRASSCSSTRRQARRRARRFSSARASPSTAVASP
jgi:leucyl aminopeptidase